MGGNWIAGAIGHPGALHQQMGVPQGQPIPQKRLQKAAGAPGLLGQRARLAETLKGFHHPKQPPAAMARQSLLSKMGAMK